MKKAKKKVIKKVHSASLAGTRVRRAPIGLRISVERGKTVTTLPTKDWDKLMDFVSKLKQRTMVRQSIEIGMKEVKEMMKKKNHKSLSQALNEL